MVSIIVGEKGKGKTKVLLEKANATMAEAKGNVVYLDKSNKHMYELNNKIRLINVKEFMVENKDEFLGFLCGIISQDNDLECVFLDSFLKVACIEAADVEPVVAKLNAISEQFKIDFVLSVSMSSADVPEAMKNQIMVAL